MTVHLRQAEQDAITALLSLPDDDWDSEHWATYDVARRTLGPVGRRIEQARERAAARPAPKRSIQARRRQDPPELARSKHIVRSRSGGICEAGHDEVCERQAVHVHHRKLRSQGGSHQAVNLLDLCGPCHDWIHAHPDEAVERGWLLRSWQRESGQP